MGLWNTKPVKIVHEYPSRHLPKGFDCSKYLPLCKFFAVSKISMMKMCWYFPN